VIATAAGTPPDIAGVWTHTIASLADRNALLPLDPYIAAEPEGGAWMDRFFPVLGELSRYGGRTYALPTMHMVSALFWNKTLFREAGLDPERPPATLAEFDVHISRLNRRDPQTKSLRQVGFLSGEPNFVHWQYLDWFGGGFWDGSNLTLASNPRNLAALHWIRAKTEEIGLDDFRAFASGAAGSSNLNFSSPQNPFYTGKLAMTFYGVWFYSYLRRFAPGLDYGCAPWPEAVPGVRDFTYAESDVIVVPRGCSNPAAAWEFMRYLSRANPQARTEAELGGIEQLAWKQKRLPPLREWSPFFTRNHPNRQLDVFRRLSASPHAATLPAIGISRDIQGESLAMFERVRNLSQTPEAAVAYVQGRLDRSWAYHKRSVERHATAT
jgi:ABC-type glycerol-3-phosphate transport system substrate-binding protein